VTLRRGLIATLVLLLVAVMGAEQKKPNPPVNRNAAVGSDFGQRVADYMKLHQKAETGLPVPKGTESPANISEFQHQLAARITALRSNAKQGDIFTPEITALFRRLVAMAMRGADGERIHSSLKRAEPVQGFHLDVNQPYPDGVPLQSTPPSLLLNLPKLPKELEYRLIGRELVLRDAPANLIVDVIPNLITAPKRKK
jgi:hypothetical protein